MAYQLKKIRFQNRDCRILLQNENGPCPLLAAANCLLLQDRIALPSSAIRNNVASLSDLTNVLANFALQHHYDNNTSGTSKASASTSKESSKDDDDKKTDTVIDDHEARLAQSHFQLNELLHIIPKLQDGMDVNPKYTAGIHGYEYTSQLTCFDLWKVQLVHGWLLDPHDNASGGDLFEAIGDKSYNELVEMVIRGHEARDKVQEIQKQLEELEKEEDETQQEEVETSSPSPPPPQPPQQQQQQEPPDLLSGDDTTSPSPPPPPPPPPATEPPSSASTTPSKKQRIQDLQDKMDIYSNAAHMSTLIDFFLQSTGHQLTHYGLQLLHTDLKPNQVVVFFRNNHFSTLTKNENDGHLYLLVTDLGYCNTPLVVWEKLDVIDGDTEYVNSEFQTPGASAAATTTASGVATSLSPEQLLAQSSQKDADYHLALHLSKHSSSVGSGTAAGSGTTGLDAQEGQLMAAATEASLREYHGLSSNITTTTGTSAEVPPPPGVEVGIPVPAPPSSTSSTAATAGASAQKSSSHGSGHGGTVVALPPAPGTQVPSQSAAPIVNSNTNTDAMTQEAADKLLAMQLAASDENHVVSSSSSSSAAQGTHDASYHLARQLQDEENQQAAARRRQASRQQQQAATGAQRGNRTAATTTPNQSDKCTIS